MSQSLKGHKVSRETRLKMSLKKRGKNHWNWNGDISNLKEKIYKLFERKQWRSDVFTRDNFTCQNCGNKRNLEAHHIKAFSLIVNENNIKNIDDAISCSELWNINNGLTLCKKCHKKTDNYCRKSNTSGQCQIY